MSRTREIPRDEWRRYFDGLARTERDRRVRVEVQDPGLGAQRLVERLPFVGLQLERRGGDEVDVTVEAGVGSAFRHRIPRAARVHALTGDDGRLACVDVECDGGRTLVRFE